MTHPPRIALLYPGDREAPLRSDAAASRFAMRFDAFAEAGVMAEPAVWNDDFADDVAAQLRSVEAVLVSCNPIESGRRRDSLDAVLRAAAGHGTFVSAHPEAVRRLGTQRASPRRAATRAPPVPRARLAGVPRLRQRVAVTPCR